MLDIVKLVKIQKKLDLETQKEFYQDLQKEVIEFCNGDTFKDLLLNAFNKPDSLISSRVFNNWQSKGLLETGYNHEGKWRRFNKIENFWINIIQDLRGFGCSLDQINEVKSHLFISDDKLPTLLELAVVYSILREPMMLLVFKDEPIKLIPQSQYASNLSSSSLLNRSHISISFLTLIKKVFRNSNLDTIAIEKNHKEITEDELKLIYFLRTGDFDEIRVVLKNGDISLIEGKAKIDPKTRIIDIIKAHDYQTIEIKVNGKNNLIIIQKIKEKVKSL